MIMLRDVLIVPGGFSTTTICGAAGQRTTTVDLNGARTTYIWDSCMLTAVVNPLNERTSYTYNRFRSRATEMNPLGFVTTYDYDNMNRPTGVQNALGNRTTVIYSGNQKVADMDALGNRTSYNYDTSNRLESVMDPRGNVWTNVYDARDLVAQMDPLGNRSTSVYDAVGRRYASISPLGLRSTQVFDAAGQLWSSIDPLGFRTSFQYDNAGNRTVVQDANGKLTTTAYASNRNLPQVTQDAMGFRTTYGFDSQSRLVTTMDARGGIVTNVYDSVGRLSIVKNQLGENVRQYGYDLAGRIVTQMDAANRCRTFTFDVAGQNTVTRYPDGGVVTNAYDSIGRRTTMTDWGGTSTYVFDANNRMSSKTASGYSQDYGYDANGNRTTLTLSGVGTITSTYDTLNRLDSARKPTGERYTMAYDNDSRRTTMLLGNGTTRQYAFDSNSRLTTQIELNGATKICTIIDGYDSVGNRITRNLDGTPVTWTYDDIYRLTGQNKSGQVCTYVMDAVGNLEVMWEGSSSNPKTFTFDVADKLTSMAEGSNTTTYTWTGYGSLETEHLRGVRTTYTYNGQDQLIGTAVSSGLTTARSTYTFDGDGLRRTAQNGNVQPTTMVWDGSDYLFLDGPSSDQLVLTLDSEIVSCGSKDLLTDPLGSLVKEISSGASLGSLIEMYPYGTLVSGTGAPTIPFVYIAALGYHFDNEQRDYVMTREFYKLLGRWMQIDPIWPYELAYAYAAGSPMAFVDRFGTQYTVPPTKGYAGQLAGGLACCFLQMGPAIKAAADFCKKYGLGPPRDGTICNAMQHCMWACLTAQKCGGPDMSGLEIAKMCTDAHEEETPFPGCPLYRQPDPHNPGAPNPPDKKCQDLYNNKVGMGCVDGDCYACCLAHIRTGNVEVLYPPFVRGWKKPRTNCKKLKR